MILTELLASTAEDAGGVRVGAVIDARFAIDGTPGQLLADARLVGLLVSPHSRSSLWGYERGGVRGPWPIGRFLRWTHRGLFLVTWEDIAFVGDGVVVLREGYERRDPVLPTHVARRT